MKDYETHPDCDHQDKLRYARRVFADGTAHYCIQCGYCNRVVKHKRHDYKLHIKHSEIPTGYQIHEFANTSDESWQGGLF